WTYNLDNTKTATNALAEGQTATEKFTVTVTDDKGATSTQDVTITITGANDSPVISFATGNAAGSVKEDATLSTTGQLTSADPDTGATATWSVSPNSPTTSSSYGTFSVDATGKWTYTLNNSSAAVQSLAQGQTVTETYTVRVTDDKGAWDDQQVTVTINGTNDVPVISQNTHVWTPDSLTEMAASAFPNGYLLRIAAPTDVDTTDVLTIKVTNIPTAGTVGYYDSSNVFHAVAVGDVLTSLQLTTLVYKPNGVATFDSSGNVITGNDDGYFKYSVTDSANATVNGQVEISTLAGTGAHTTTVTIGDGSHPLNSGSSQTTNYIVDSNISNDSNYNTGAIVLKTDFQVAPFQTPISGSEIAQATSAVEAQVSVSINIAGHVFNVVQANDGVANWTLVNSGNVTFSSSVSFTNIKDSNGLSLADFLTSHPPTTGDSWTVTYMDNTGGNEQARYLSVGFVDDVNGSTKMVATGDGTIDIMYGSTQNDTLTGNGGNDILVGGKGDDVMFGGAGSDIFEYHTGDLTGVVKGDTISDFTVANPSAGGDVLDISALLTGTHAANGSDLVSGGYLRFDAVTHNSDGTTTVKLSVDADGSAGSGSAFVPLATITMSGLSATATQADILNALVNNHEIKA
ncbi:uncharacterized protein NMK_0001, partial [Novimethylophilus kurashikiensis]